MSKRLDRETLEVLDQACVDFLVCIEIPGGGNTLALSIDQLQDFVEDPAHWYAKSMGVSKQDYLDWLEADGLPRCGATTKSGARCKNPVSGGIHRDLLNWLNEEAGYCTTHGGDSSEEAKSKRWEKWNG